MSKHTPAPWRLTDDHKTRRVIKGGSPESSVVIVESWTKEADARLIAAAPDLLQALRDAVACLGGISSANVPESVRAAIAKAEGT